MTPYRFLTTWVLESPVGPVWDAINDTDSWRRRRPREAPRRPHARGRLSRSDPRRTIRKRSVVTPLNARREASVRAQGLAQRGHEVPLDHVEEDAGDGILPVEELLERVA